MSLYDDLIAALPELKDLELFPYDTIVLQNDADATGDYIAKWEYSKPIPDGLKLGK